MWTHKDMFGVTALTSTNANLTHEKYVYILESMYGCM